MRKRLEGWLALADERLRPQGKRLLFMLGNDDPPPLARLLDDAPVGRARRGQDHLAGRRPRDDQLGLLEQDALEQLPRAG